GGSFHPALSRSQNTKPTLIRAKRYARRSLHFSRAVSVISVPASAFETGQFCFAPCAYSWNFASSIPGISASVSSAIPVIENASPTFSSLTVAVVCMRVGLICARDNAAVSAMVKQPACAAPINSSGLVADSPSSNRDLNEYGPSNAPLPTFNRPLPSARLPNHSASAFLDGITSYPPHTI